MMKVISLMMAWVVVGAGLVHCSSVQSAAINTNHSNASYSKESGTNVNYSGSNANISIKRNASTAQ